MELVFRASGNTDGGPGSGIHHAGAGGSGLGDITFTTLSAAAGGPGLRMRLNFGGGAARSDVVLKPDEVRLMLDILAKVVSVMPPPEI